MAKPTRRSGRTGWMGIWGRAAGRAGRDPHRRRRRLRPDVLALEGRQLLATFTVTTTRATGVGSLTYEINQAEGNVGETDTVDFDPSVFATHQTIQLSSTLKLTPASVLSGGHIITEPVSLKIDGPALGVTIAGDGSDRAIEVEAGVTATLTGLTITGGKTTGDGGGLYNQGTTSLDDCTISGNTAAALGGGIASDSILFVSDSTITGNTAGEGGGITATSEATLQACTVTGNFAGTGSGLVTRGYLTLQDTVIAGDETAKGAASDDEIDFGKNESISGSNNVIGTVAASFPLSSSDNLLDVTDPLLSPLGNYGGPSQTIALLPGSPAIGYGTAISGVTTDERGMPLDSPNVDVGAFQTNPLVVNTTDDGSYTKRGDLGLRQAVNLADALDGSETVRFDPTAFATAKTINVNGIPLDLTGANNEITINGPSAGVTIDGDGEGGVFEVESGVTATLSGLTVQGGSTAGDGGGLWIDGTANLDDCTITGNTAADGGGVYNAGVVRLTGTTVSDNSAAGYGGGIDNANAGKANISGSTITGNSAGKWGGGLMNFGPARLIDSTLSGNTAGEGGGIFNATGGRPTISYCAITGNSAASFGGGMVNVGTATLTDTTVTGNSVGTDGGGIFNFDNATISGCTISGNTATMNGGGVASEGTLALTDTAVSGNATAKNNGGGIFNFDNATISDCTITDNSAAGDGGGLANQGTASLTDCTISDNSSAASGGGLVNQGTASLTDCTISGNSAADTGGGQQDVGNGNVAMLTNCTISGNSASHYGGGIDAVGQTLGLTDCTVSGNAAQLGGGLDLGSITTTLENTIVAANTGGDIDGNVTGSDNLVGTGGSGGLTDGVDGNIVGVANPGLGTLGNYGGPTQTVPLLPGSPAIGAGTPVSGITTDQRGISRPDSDPDIGAFQDRGFTITLISGNDQSTPVDDPFGDDLAVTVSSPSGDPVAGGMVTFTAPSSGASATFGPVTATIGPSGQASTSATANGAAGPYDVVASAAGANSVSFTLTNTVAAVTGLSVSWGASGTAAMVLPTSPGGTILPTGRKNDVPWLGIDAFTVTLDAPVPLSAADVTVTSAIGASYGPVTVSGSGETYTITLAHPVDAADRVTITIGDAAVTAFSGVLPVLPGDVDDLGVVNAQDLEAVEQQWLGIVTATMFGDITGDGTPTSADYLAVRQRIGTTLPPAP